MLFQATVLVDLTAMAICLWMAFYLFARGFPSRVTMRGVILLLSLSAFFFGTYNNIFNCIGILTVRFQPKMRTDYQIIQISGCKGYLHSKPVSKL